MNRKELLELIAPYQNVVVDLGTGDGRHLLDAARKAPDIFHIGIDSNVGELRRTATRAERKPRLDNVLFARANVDDLPNELTQLANAVTVEFPWGRLLQTLVNPDIHALMNIRRMCVTGARLDVLVALDAVRDHSELKRLGIDDRAAQFASECLKKSYLGAGFSVCAVRVLSAAERKELTSSWGRRLAHSQRTIRRIVAVATEASPAP